MRVLAVISHALSLSRNSSSGLACLHLQTDSKTRSKVLTRLHATQRHRGEVRQISGMHTHYRIGSWSWRSHCKRVGHAIFSLFGQHDAHEHDQGSQHGEDERP